MFVATGSGTTVVNLNHVVSIEQPRSGEWGVATLTDGRTLKCAGDIAEQDGAIVAAPPGLLLVEAFEPAPSEVGASIGYALTAIVAFRIPWAKAPIPVTLQGEPGLGLMSAVIQPDGQCVSADTSWDTLDEFKAACERVARMDREPARSVTAAPDVPSPQSIAPAPVASEPTRTETPGEPTAVAQLRARIQAEPIEAPFADAPWRPGRDFAEVIDEVRRTRPDLHEAGVGYSPRWGWKWEPGALERHRADMTTAGNIKAFEAALRFLSHAGRQFARPRVNRKRTSYSWKHAAERVMGIYVPNGMLIAAAYALGFTVEVNRDSPNPYINLGEKAVELDPQRGA